MQKKSTLKPAAKTIDKKKAQPLKQTEEQTQKQKMNHLINDASFANACAIELFAKQAFGDDFDLVSLVVELDNNIKTVKEGDLSELEAMLVSQAKALQLIFLNLTRRAGKAEYIRHLQAYMPLALKAQAQSRATIQAIVELKYPRQVIVTQQANIANNAPQQVNNSQTITATTTDIETNPRARRKKQTVQNELLEQA